MENWEFLLQKEGDRTWLPLESADVEILEGRYRLIARSHWVNTEIEITILYQSTEEHPPQRRIQKRTSQTNPEGLIVIIPYTRLKPGIWEFTCSLVDASGVPGQPSQKSFIQLQVLSTEGELSTHPHYPEESDDLLSEEDENVLETPSSLAPSEEINPPVELLEEKTQHEENLPENSPSNLLETSPTEGEEILEETPHEGEEIQEETRSPEVNTPVFQESPLSFKLTLDQDNLVVELGRPLTLYGRIDVLEKSQVTEAELNYLEKITQTAQLEIRLRDPGKTDILAEIHQPLSQGEPPWIFACMIYIPSVYKSRVFLAEATLKMETETLVSETFILNADVSQLLEVIEEDFQEELHQFTATKKSLKQNQIVLDRSLLDLVEPSQHSDTFLATVPLDQVIIPPQIKTRETPHPHAIELPSFGQPLPESLRQESGFPQIAEPPSPSPPLSSPPSDSERVEKEEKRKGEIRELFPSVPVKDRFLSRLNALVGDEELLEWLKTTPGETETSPDENPEATSEETSVPVTPPPRETQEIVVDDYEPLEFPQRSLKTTFEKNFPKPSLSLSETVADILPENTPIPVPSLQVLNPEIIAGRTIKIRVEIAEVPSRIYIKLWVYDRQSYNIIEGPRWLTDLIPGRVGMLEATTELEIPYGSLEIEIEAIAVEVGTQRESHKATILRRVLPPPPPSLPLENQKF